MSKWLLLPTLILFHSLHGSIAQEARSAEQIVRNSCMACHGLDGNQPASPDFPRIGGQHKEYIEKALADYISGRRKDHVMRAQVVDVVTGKAFLSDAEVKAVAVYFAGRPGLSIK
jgi:cytochrome c553